MSRNRDFDEFVARHQHEVVRALTLALADRARAEDAAQEAFAAVYRRWRRVAAMDRPVGWVYVVALNGARRELRRDAAAPVPDVASPSPDPAGPASARVTVADALGTLAPRQRVAVVLRYLADLPLADVAAAMGVSVGTAKATLHAALARLRVELAPGDLDDAIPQPAPLLTTTLPPTRPTNRSSRPADPEVALP